MLGEELVAELELFSREFLMKDWASRRRFELFLFLLLRARGDVTIPTSLAVSESLWVTPGCAERGKLFDFPAKLVLEEGAAGGEDEASPKLRATLGLRLIIPDTDADSVVPA